MYAGSNTGGQLGLGDLENRAFFSRVSFEAMTVCDTLSPFNLSDSFIPHVCVGGPDRPLSLLATAVAAGDSHTLATTQDGNVWTWGLNDHGQLGVGYLGEDSSLPLSTIPLPLATLFGANASSAAGGKQHSILRTGFQQAVIHEVLPRVGPASAGAMTMVWWLGLGFNSLRQHRLVCRFDNGAALYETAARVFSNFRAVCPSPAAASQLNNTQSSAMNATHLHSGLPRLRVRQSPLYMVSLYSIGVDSTDATSSQPKQPTSETTSQTVAARRNFTFHMLEECTLPVRWDCSVGGLAWSLAPTRSIPLSGPRQGGTNVTVVGCSSQAQHASNDLLCLCSC